MSNIRKAFNECHGASTDSIEYDGTTNNVKKIFNEWADNGRAEKMEHEHSWSVMRRLETVRIPRRFLDVGCGNGWVVRRMASDPECRIAVGIDKSPKMIHSARRKSTSAKERYIVTDIMSWNYRGRFDFVFAMESLYYADSVDDALCAIYRLLAPGGTLICGTDFYKENKATRWWGREMKTRMHLMSRAEWTAAFRRAGLTPSSKTIKNSAGSKKWMRDAGTLFVTGVKPS